MKGWPKTEELERIWKEVVLSYSSYYLGICMEELGETTETLCQDNQCPDYLGEVMSVYSVNSMKCLNDPVLWLKCGIFEC
jgi:hypothetical protein